MHLLHMSVLSESVYSVRSLDYGVYFHSTSVVDSTRSDCNPQWNTCSFAGTRPLCNSLNTGLKRGKLLKVLNFRKAMMSEMMKLTMKIADAFLAQHQCEWTLSISAGSLVIFELPSTAAAVHKNGVKLHKTMINKQTYSV